MTQEFIQQTLDIGFLLADEANMLVAMFSTLQRKPFYRGEMELPCRKKPGHGTEQDRDLMAFEALSP